MNSRERVADQVQAVLDDILETQRDYLPQFWETR